jgi:hypothetical protein
VKEDEEVTVTVVLKVTQADAEQIGAEGVVDVNIEGHSVLLSPLGLGDDGAFVERLAGASS